MEDETRMAKNGEKYVDACFRSLLVMLCTGRQQFFSSRRSLQVGVMNGMTHLSGPSGASGGLAPTQTGAKVSDTRFAGANHKRFHGVGSAETTHLQTLLVHFAGSTTEDNAG